MRRPGPARKMPLPPQPALRRGLVALLAERPNGVTPLEVGRAVLCLQGPSALVSRAGLRLLQRLGARRAAASRRYALPDVTTNEADDAAGGLEAALEEVPCASAPRAAREVVAGAPVAAELRAALDSLPDGPGVYRLLGDDGAVIYVGKARSLRQRVPCYFAPSSDTRRLAAELRLATARFEVDETGSELGALLEELRQIRALRPRFNVQLAVRERSTLHGRFVLFLPGAAAGSIELLALRQGVVVGQALTDSRGRSMRAVWTLLGRCLADEQPAPQPSEEDRIVASFVRRERDRCNLLDLGRVDGVRDAARLVRVYLAEPTLFTAKLFVR